MVDIHEDKYTKEPNGVWGGGGCGFVKRGLKKKSVSIVLSLSLGWVVVGAGVVVVYSVMLFF